MASRSAGRPAWLDADIGSEARVLFFVGKELFFAIIRAEEILLSFVRAPELRCILVNDCKTDRIRCHGRPPDTRTSVAITINLME
jgi:hypothetical protein